MMMMMMMMMMPVGRLWLVCNIHIYKLSITPSTSVWINLQKATFHIYMHVSAEWLLHAIYLEVFGCAELLKSVHKIFHFRMKIVIS